MSKEPPRGYPARRRPSFSKGVLGYLTPVASPAPSSSSSSSCSSLHESFQSGWSAMMSKESPYEFYNLHKLLRIEIQLGAELMTKSRIAVADAAIEIEGTLGEVLLQKPHTVFLFSDILIFSHRSAKTPAPFLSYSLSNVNIDLLSNNPITAWIDDIESPILLHFESMATAVEFRLLFEVTKSNWLTRSDGGGAGVIAGTATATGSRGGGGLESIENSLQSRGRPLLLQPSSQDRPHRKASVRSTTTTTITESFIDPFFNPPSTSRPCRSPSLTSSASSNFLAGNGEGGGLLNANWIPDHEATECMMPHCRVRFSMFTRRHHCRQCGRVMCSKCSAFVVKSNNPAAPSTTKKRVCLECFTDLDFYSDRAV